MTATPCPAPGLPTRALHSHKGDYGKVLVVGGSRGLSGAIGLTGISALRTGSGLVSAFIPSLCLETVAGLEPCLMTLPATHNRLGEFGLGAASELKPRLPGHDAIAVGPGMGRGAGSLKLVRLLAGCSEVPRVFDADALNLIAADSVWRIQGPAILTPHPGEFQRLSGVPAHDRAAQIVAASALANRHGIVVVLKGAATVITNGRDQRVNQTGNAGMATAGSGDCLTGVITSLLGQGLGTFDAAVLGAHVHGLAGDFAANTLGQAGMLATDLIHHLPAAVRRCERLA